MEIVKLGSSSQPSPAQQNLTISHPHQQCLEDIETVVCRIPVFVFHQLKYAIDHDRIGDTREGPIKGSWSKEEDRTLSKLVQENGAKRWSELAEHIKGRNGKQCRERYLNHLDPSIKKEPFSEEEDRLIIQYHQTCGNQWAKIARNLDGRTPNSVKNRWNCTLRRKLREGRKVQKRRKLIPSMIPALPPQFQVKGERTPPNHITGLPHNSTPFTSCPPKPSLKTPVLPPPSLSTSSAPFPQQQQQPSQHYPPQQQQQAQQRQGINVPATTISNKGRNQVDSREVVYHEIFPPPQFTSPPQYHKIFDQPPPSDGSNPMLSQAGPHPITSTQQQREMVEGDDTEQQIRFYQEQMKYVDFVSSFNPQQQLHYYQKNNHQPQHHQAGSRRFLPSSSSSHLQRHTDLLQKPHPRNQTPQLQQLQQQQEQEREEEEEEEEGLKKLDQATTGGEGKEDDDDDDEEEEEEEEEVLGFPFDPNLIVSRIRNEQTSDGKLIRRFVDEDPNKSSITTLPPFHDSSSQFSPRRVTTKTD